MLKSAACSEGGRRRRRVDPSSTELPSAPDGAGDGGADSDTRVVRGGAFNNNERNVRAAIRNRNTPDNRNNNVGCRLVVSTFFLHRNCPPAALVLAGRGEEWRSLFLAASGAAGPGE